MAQDVALPSDDRALEELLRERRFGPPDPDESTPWDFVRRWPLAELRGRVWPVISRLLIDDDDVVRARALEFVATWSDGADLTAPRLIEAAEQHPDRFDGTKVENVSLRRTLAFALGNRTNTANGPRIAAVLREMATHEPIDGGSATVLGTYEPAFAAERAMEWGDTQANWIVEAASSVALFRRDELIPFLQAISGLGQATRTRVLAEVEKFIKRDDETANAVTRVERLPPPTKPAPSADECKRAIGL